MICDRNKITLEQQSTERNRIPSCSIFRGMVQNGIPSVCFYFCSTERNFTLFFFRRMVQTGIPRVCFYNCSMAQNSKHFSPLRNGSEGNSESFLFCGIAGILPVHLPRTNFLSEIANYSNCVCATVHCKPRCPHVFVI